MGRPHITKAVREAVKNRFGGRCGYCGELSSKLHIDHVIPVAQEYQLSYQVHSEMNLMPACQSCNLYKTSLQLETFRREIQASVRKARDYSVNYRFAERYGLVEEKPKPVVFYFERVRE